MTLMLHAGANPVEYDALRELQAPAATETHVPIPHFRVVDLVQMYRQQVIGVQAIADVLRQWEEPSHDWGPKTGFRLFNAATHALTGRVIRGRWGHDPSVA